MKEAKYVGFGQILVEFRTRKALKQDELAHRLGTTQQSLSRWELGTSRPRVKEMGAISAVLEEPLATLLAASGYAGESKIAASFDRHFPLDTLAGSDTFERFCTTFLDLKFGRASRLGGQGHTQHGFDIIVERDDGAPFAFQCKQVRRFGPKDVELAISKGSGYSAQKKVLLLARVASPQARESLKDSGWELWDQDDISREIRKLALSDQINLVDQFFKGSRLALLGEDEAGPWESLEEFFKPYLTGGIFSHSWELVGRESERHQLVKLICDSQQRVTVLEGPGGLGKTRLLLSTLRAISNLDATMRIRMLSPTSAVTPKNLEDLGSVPTLIVVDDAHDRDDLGQLLRYAVGRENCQLLISSRPYALDSLRLQASRVGFLLDSIVKLAPLRLTDAIELAKQALVKESGNPEFAGDIAEIAVGNPLFIILASQIVSRDGLHPQFLGKTKEFEARIYLEFERIITQKLVPESEVPALREVLSVVSLVQPVISDDKQLFILLEQAKGIGAPQAGRLLRALTDGGILFQRAKKLRLSPDLLADSIIERSCYTVSGSSGYAESLFDSLPEAYIPNLLFNLGKLDWRKHEGELSTSILLDNVWGKLRWKRRYINLHVKAAVGAAFFHPRQAMHFVNQLIEQGHGEDADVTEILKQIAYRPEFLKEALDKLWELVRCDNRPHERVNGHPISVLEDLATPAIERSLDQLEQVVQYHIALLARPQRWGDNWTPFDVLKGAFAIDGQSTRASGYDIQLTTYGLNYDVLVKIRDLAINAILSNLTSTSLRLAYAAAGALSYALAPGRRSSEDVTAKLTEEAKRILKRVRDVQMGNTIAPVVQVAIARSVHWRAAYAKDATSDIARQVFDSFHKDDARTTVIRMLTDSYELESELDEANDSYDENNRHRDQVVEQVLEEFPQLDELVRFLEGCIEEVQEARAVYLPGNHSFISRLIGHRTDLAKAVFQWKEQDIEHPLVLQAECALATLLKTETAFAQEKVQGLLAQNNNESLELLARTYANTTDEERLSETGRRVLRKVFGAKSSKVLSHVRFLAACIADQEPRFALELLALVDLSLMERPQEVFMVLGRQRLIPDELLDSQSSKAILENLSRVRQLGDHYILDYLSRIAKKDARPIAELVRKRFNEFLDSDDAPITGLARGRRDGGVLHLLEAPHGEEAMHYLLDWALEKIEDYRFRFSFGQTINTLFAPIDSVALVHLEDWMRRGTNAHVNVVAEILRHAQWAIYRDEVNSVISILDSAEKVSLGAVKRLISALYGCSISGMRMGSPGKPYPRDIEMEKFCEETLQRLNPLEPAVDLYKDLLSHAKQSIARQLDEGMKLLELREESDLA